MTVANGKPQKQAKPVRPEEIVPPHDEDAELSVLGCVLLDPSLLEAVAELLRPDDFYQPRCGRIFGELLAMLRDGDPITGHTLMGRLRTCRALPGIVNESDFHDIDQHTTTAANWRYYADLVSEIAEERRALFSGPHLARLGADSYRARHNREAWRAEIEAIPRQIFREKGEAAGIDHGWKTFADFMAQDVRQNYLVDGIVPEAQGAIISGRFKTLKTSIALDLFISMATGTPFLGQFKVPTPVPCGLMTSEAGPAAIIGTSRRICAAKGIDYRDGPDLTVMRAKMTDPRHLEAMERNIDKHGWKCVGIDPTYLAFAAIGDSATNVFKMGDALEPVTSLIQRTGCSVTLLNHNTKGRMKDVGRFDPPDLAEISMSGFAEWMRFWLLLAQSDDWQEVTGTHRLWMRTGGSAGHAALHGLEVIEGEHDARGNRTHWDVTLRDATEARQERESKKANSDAVKRERTEEEHVRKLRDTLQVMRNEHPDRFDSERALRGLSGLNPGNFGPAMRTLLKRGEVEQTTIKKGGNQCVGYRLKDGGGTGWTKVDQKADQNAQEGGVDQRAL